jgi:hypothetical protein
MTTIGSMAQCTWDEFFAAWLTTHGGRVSRSTEKQARLAWQIVQRQSSQVDNNIHVSVDAGAKPWRPGWLEQPVVRMMSIRALASNPQTQARLCRYDSAGSL